MGQVEKRRSEERDGGPLFLCDRYNNENMAVATLLWPRCCGVPRDNGIIAIIGSNKETKKERQESLHSSVITHCFICISSLIIDSLPRIKLFPL